MPSGDTESWDHDDTTDTVTYGVNVGGVPADLLATEVTGLTFTGFAADGATETTVVDDVQCVRVDVTVQLPREVGGARVIRSWAWIRAW
jgi:hypothetical protein